MNIFWLEKDIEFDKRLESVKNIIIVVGGRLF